VHFSISEGNETVSAAVNNIKSLEINYLMKKGIEGNQMELRIVMLFRFTLAFESQRDTIC